MRLDHEHQQVVAVTQVKQKRQARTPARPQYESSSEQCKGRATVAPTVLTHPAYFTHTLGQPSYKARAGKSSGTASRAAGKSGSALTNGGASDNASNGDGSDDDERKRLREEWRRRI